MEVVPMEPSPPAAPPPLATQPAPSATTAKIVYVLYLASFLVGVTALVGVVIAYVHHGDAPEPLRSHYRFQIRTFWIGLLYTAGAALLSLFVIGLLFLAFVAVWLVVRCVKGLKHLERREPYPNLETWLW
jgi:uncharacterized membrane protein